MREAKERQPLSEREREILALLATGATNQEIARALYISPNTVKVHLRNIYAKLGVMNRSEAILVGLREGIITLPGMEVGEESSAEVDTPPPIPVDMPYLARVLGLAAVVAVVLVAAILMWPRWATRSQALNVRDVTFSDLSRPRGNIPTRRNVPRWVPQSPLVEGRARAAVAVWQGKVYLIGGETAHGVVNTVSVYDPTRGVWSTAAAKPTPVSNAQATVVEDRIYVYGGTDKTFLPTDVVEVYDPVRDVWTSGGTLPYPMAGYALAVWQGKVLLFGGWDGHRYLSSVYMHDPEAGTWTVLSPLPQARAFAVAVVLGDLVYLVGGYDGQVDVADVWVFDVRAALRGDTPWSEGPPLLSPRGGAAGVVVSSSLYVIGGGIGVPVDGAERYDPVSETWARVETPFGPNWRHLAAVTVGGDVYAIGGWAGTYLPVTERYRASFRNFIPFGPVNLESP